jgi:hypothetical protein
MPAPRSAWSWLDGAVVAGMAVLGAAVFWAMHHALVDDAYITLDYARTLAQNHQWGLLPGHPANTATSPLNVLLLGALTMVVGGPVKALGMLFVLNSAVLAVGLLGLGRRTGLGRRFALVAGPLLLLNPLLASTAGLETMLAVTALVWLLWTSGGERAWPVGVVAGLTVLIRLDLVVVVAAVLLLRRRLWRRLPWVLLWTIVVAAPWFLFSWRFLGSAVPDTLLIKTASSWGNYAVGLVRKYGTVYPYGVLGTLEPAVLGLLAVLSWPLWRRWIPGPDAAAVPIAGAAALVYYVTFVLLGVSPFFWYYGLSTAALVLAAAALVAALTLRRSLLLRVAAAGLGLAIALVPAGVAWARGLSQHTPLNQALVRGNWARPSQYTRIGRALPGAVGEGVAVMSPGEIGTLLYFCHCPLVDGFSDRARLVPDIAAHRRESILWRLNYHWLDTRRLRQIDTSYHLKWEPGFDPSGRGWNVYSLTGHGRRGPQGYLALLKPGGRPAP